MTRTRLIIAAVVASSTMAGRLAVAQVQSKVSANGFERQWWPGSPDVFISQELCSQTEPSRVNLTCGPIIGQYYSSASSLSFQSGGAVCGSASGSTTPKCNRWNVAGASFEFRDTVSLAFERVSIKDPPPTPPFTIYAHVVAGGSISPINDGPTAGSPHFGVSLQLGAVQMFYQLRQAHGAPEDHQMPMTVPSSSFFGTVLFTGAASSAAFRNEECLLSWNSPNSYGGPASVQATLLGFSATDALGHVVRVQMFGSGGGEPLYRDVVNDPPICPGDVPIGGGPPNGTVNIDDLVAVITTWGSTGLNIVADINFDQIVNIDDLVQVITHWGTCP